MPKNVVIDDYTVLPEVAEAARRAGVVVGDHLAPGHTHDELASIEAGQGDHLAVGDIEQRDAVRHATDPYGLHGEQLTPRRPSESEVIERLAKLDLVLTHRGERAKMIFLLRAASLSASDDPARAAIREWLAEHGLD